MMNTQETVNRSEQVAPTQALGVTESGKLLMVFDAGASAKLQIQEEWLDVYVYLLNVRNILRFYYHFRFDPLPYSGDLQEDVERLLRLHYLSKGSPLHITEQGQERLRRILKAINIQDDNYNKLRSSIENELKKLVILERDELFNEVYKGLKP